MSVKGGGNNGDSILNCQAALDYIHSLGNDARVAIVGPANYGNPDGVDSFVSGLPTGTTIVSGSVPGIDVYARYSDPSRITGIAIDGPSNLLGNPGAYNVARDRSIVDNADTLVIFDDNLSARSLRMMDYAEEKGMPVWQIPSFSPC
jgi:hypothetical protein